MGRLLKGEFSTAVRMLSRNRGRSVLTMFGIIIGVASVVTVVAIGQGVAEQVARQTERLGSDLITIRPGSAVSGTDGFFGGLSAPANQMAGALSQNDVTAVAATRGVASVTPLNTISAGLTANGSGYMYRAPIIGTTSNFPSMLGQSVAYGTFLTGESTDVNKIILGAHVAEKLFTQNVPLGQAVRILGQDFIVVGILKETQTAPLSPNLDFNNAVFISSDEAQTLTNNNARMYEILARPAKPAETDVVADRLRSALLAAHGGQQDFSVLKQGQTMSVTNSILGLLTALVIGVACVSLLVGGIGIMNVMLVSVTERMHEIGIRKAVGATNRQILRQFVIEAAVLSSAGAVIGVLLAAVIDITLQITTNLAPDITWQTVVLACVTAMAIGMTFGIAPALKASRRDPISALRDI